MVPCGPAAAVIHATASFAALKHLHNLDCSGIIDRDFRTEYDVEHLRKKGVSCLDVSEIENLFLEEDVLRATAHSLHREDVEALIADAKEKVFEQLASDKERLVSAIVAARIERSFTQFNAKATGAEGLRDAVETLLAGIDVQELYQAAKADIDGILQGREYKAALRIFNNKGLVPQVERLFGFRPRELILHIRRLLISKDNGRILDAFRAALPEVNPLVVAPDPTVAEALEAD